ncbi:MAG: hypothetical protein GKS00_23360 [Alphaproteobacteria bacterium]|nr:hypothetical protein [Alphaproteobacteria bacterium]
MIKFKGYFLSCFAVVAVALVPAWPSAAATENDDGTFTQLARRAPPPAGFRKLTGLQIQRLVIALGKANHPDSDQHASNTDWVIHFKRSRRADRGKVDFVSPTADSFGTWHVKRNKLCIRVKGGDGWDGNTVPHQPHHGCFAVYVHPKKGEVVAYLPRMRLYRFVMAEDAADAIAKVLPKR